MTAAEPPHLFGGWSEYLYVVPGSFLVRVPDDLPDEVAVLTEVMAVAVGLDRAKQFSAVPNEAFRFDDTVVVLGVGSLGMCFLMKARMLGAGTIVAVDLSAYRLAMAQRLGAHAPLHAPTTPPAERLPAIPDPTHRPRAGVGVGSAGVAPGGSQAVGKLR